MLNATHKIQLRMTSAAKRELDLRNEPLCVYLELLFSCLIRKKTYFLSSHHPDSMLLDAHQASVEIWFRAVGAKTCSISDQPVQDLQTFPLKRTDAFIPRWLSLDYRKGEWIGEFGYIL
ncbi:conserved protein of unknown function [Acidithiobacillus ferrivorans]|jgi:hypothetical protein|uniref:Uncharacterized protein n=2 Tax=Acidithiobacillus ferrivorans TaxID=160808 RepID=A0A060UL35_9PROT|nr:hypothetical protein [Acidithiobacillus ferrivorans]QQD73415.1 hypothetical protein H2515_03785 [Acidithiobacillus ferrivorans]CDQ09046.1 conserved hypothetical protein [Acidithiobacillus ferrivorans]SMH65623.1 conserved protein of unknown function [Acidithiobacillus ferrivorans]